MTQQEREELKRKYGVVTMEISILERVLPENQLKTITEMYRSACKARGKRAITDNDIQKDIDLVQSLYKKGYGSEKVKEITKFSDFRLGRLLAKAMEKGML